MEVALLRQNPITRPLLDKAALFQKVAIASCRRFAVGDVA